MYYEDEEEKRAKWRALRGVMALLIIMLVVGMSLLAVFMLSYKESTQSVSTQSTYAGKVSEVRRQDGVPLVEVSLTEGPVQNHKVLAIASTNLVVGEAVRLVWVSAPGGKYFPVARPITDTNSWP